MNGLRSLKVATRLCVAAAALFVALAVVVDAAMTFEQMFKDATHAFAGTVVEVDAKDHDQEGFVQWTNRHHRLTVNVTSVGKTRGLPEKERNHHRREETERELRHAAEGLPPHEGPDAVEHPDHVQDPLHDDERIAVGDLVHVHFWRAVARPPGYKFPDAPGITGLRHDLELTVGADYAFFGEYLNRDRVRRFMYHHTHPGAVRRRKHVTSASASRSQSAAAGEDGATPQAQPQAAAAAAVEPFDFVKAYIAFVPDGITADVPGAISVMTSERSARADL
jgi:hypothetical protein